MNATEAATDALGQRMASMVLPTPGTSSIRWALAQEGDESHAHLHVLADDHAFHVGDDAPAGSWTFFTSNQCPLLAKPLGREPGSLRIQYPSALRRSSAAPWS